MLASFVRLVNPWTFSHTITLYGFQYCPRLLAQFVQVIPGQAHGARTPRIKEGAMATKSDVHQQDVGGTGRPAAETTNKDEAKKAINKATGHAADGNLTEEQLVRAAVEYLHALRPQPAPADIKAALVKVAEKDDKGELKHKLKDTDAVAGVADGALTEATKAA